MIFVKLDSVAHDDSNVIPVHILLMEFHFLCFFDDSVSEVSQHSFVD